MIRSDPDVRAPTDRFGSHQAYGVAVSDGGQCRFVGPPRQAGRSDGGIFAFDAPFKGSLGGVKLNKPVVGMVRYSDGYLMVGADGGIFNFSNSPFSGSLGDKPPASPVVAVAALPV